MRSFLLLMAAFAQVAFARPIHTVYEGIRPLGMGNAFLALADDKNALWHNPAGLGLVTTSEIDYYDLLGAVDSDATLSQLYQGFFQGRNEIVRTDTQYARLGFFPAYIRQYFGISAFYHLLGLSSVEDLEVSQVEIFGVNDIGITVGGAVPIGRHFLLGASARLTQRQGLDLSGTPSQVVESSGVLEAEFLANVYSSATRRLGRGSGLGANAGLLFRSTDETRLPRLHLAAVAENIGQTTYRAQDGRSAPPSDLPGYGFGAAFLYPFIDKRSLVIAADMKELFQNRPLLRSFHTGVEYREGIYAFRLGYDSGFVSAGIGLEWSQVVAQVATSALAITEGSPDRSVRSFLFQLILRSPVVDPKTPRPLFTPAVIR